MRGKTKMIGSKKTTFTEDVKHATAQPPPLGPLLEEVARNVDGWGSTLVPLTLLKAGSRHADKLNNDRMSYYVRDATKVIMVECIKGSNLWIFCGVLSSFFTTTIFWRLSTGRIQPHAGFITTGTIPSLIISVIIWNTTQTKGPNY